MSAKTISIDGSLGTGGGQILRTAVGLSAALGRSVEITNIRSGRAKPGLGHQHLSAVRAAAAICNARLTGDALSSSEVIFRPGCITAGTYRFEVPTSGSACLVLQTVIPALMLADGESTVTVIGGTHNPLAPPFEYLRDVFAVLASSANLRVCFELSRAGLYPAGGGQIKMTISGIGSPENVSAMRFTERGRLRRIDGVSAVTSKLPYDIAVRQSDRVRSRLAQSGKTVSMDKANLVSDSPGTAVFLRAVFARSVAGFSSLGKQGKPAEHVADEAADALLNFIGSPGVIDSRAADQLVTIAGMARGQSRFVTDIATDHLRTNAEAVRRITGRAIDVIDSTNRGATVIIGDP